MVAAANEFDAFDSSFEEYPDIDRHSCELLGPIALTVQGLMGILVILSLVYKRHREKPIRPWRIWLFDVSKQVVGQLFVHGVNVLVSDLVSQHSSENACVFYFLNILVDTTLGVALIYLILRVLTFVMNDKFHLKGFESGVYGNPPSFYYWARQAAIYVCALTTMKFLVIGLLALFPGMFTIGAWLLSWTWTGDGDALQVIFTMGIFPIIMNILQFWLIDSIVKASVITLEDDAPDAFDRADREPLFGVPSDDEDDNLDAPHYDIENPRPAPRTRSPSGSRSRSSDKDVERVAPFEPKTSGSNTPGQSLEMHSYPPSLSGSVTSQSTSSSSSSSPPSLIKEATKLNKPKRRNPPAPLNIHDVHQPAVNSPQRVGKRRPVSPRISKPAASPPETTVPPSETIKVAGASESNEAWGDPWDDCDDWANRVGEEDWTGRRMEHKKDQLNSADVWNDQQSTVAS